MQVNMHEAKSQLSKLGEKAWEGETAVIAKAIQHLGASIGLHLLDFDLFDRSDAERQQAV